MKIRRLLAVWTSKIIGTACRLTGRQGVTLAGQLAIRIYPGILKELSQEVREKIFVVCGTNGKTTTNNLLCSAIEAEGKKVVCNHTGSNRTGRMDKRVSLLSCFHYFARSPASESCLFIIILSQFSLSRVHVYI